MDSLKGNASVASRVVPAASHAPVLRAWSGLTALTADHLPLLGSVPRRPGLFVATGETAFTLGPTYARLMAAIVAGQAPTLDITPYSLDRFGFLSHV